MGTTIYFTYNTGQYIHIPLSNSAGAAIVYSLVVAGSRYLLQLFDDLQSQNLDWSEIKWEIDLISHLATRDRCVLYNSEGFHLGQLGWTDERFWEQKETFLRIIEMAMWKTMSEIESDFAPERLLPNLGAVRLMLNNMVPDDIPENTDFEWWMEQPETIQFCPKHKVILHIEGCMVCHQRGLYSEDLMVVMK